jgi:RNA polymerase sigma factor (sigma-70 family)
MPVPPPFSEGHELLEFAPRPQPRLTVPQAPAPTSRPARSQEFDRLWKTHQKEMKARCRALLGNSADAEDAYSRTALLALENYARYADVLRDPRAWLLRLVINTCITVMRERRREKHIEAAAGELAAASTGGGLQDVPEEQYAQKQIRKRLRRALSMHIYGLPRRLRQPLVLRLVLNKDYEFVAERLDITLPNARKRVQHAREELIDVLQDSLEDLIGAVESYKRPGGMAKKGRAVRRGSYQLRSKKEHAQRRS